MGGKKYEKKIVIVGEKLKKKYEQKACHFKSK